MVELGVGSVIDFKYKEYFKYGVNKGLLTEKDDISQASVLSINSVVSLSDTISAKLSVLDGGFKHAFLQLNMPDLKVVKSIEVIRTIDYIEKSKKLTLKQESRLFTYFITSYRGEIYYYQMYTKIDFDDEELHHETKHPALQIGNKKLTLLSEFSENANTYTDLRTFVFIKSVFEILVQSDIYKMAESKVREFINENAYLFNSVNNFGLLEMFVGGPILTQIYFEKNIKGGLHSDSENNGFDIWHAFISADDETTTEILPLLCSRNCVEIKRMTYHVTKKVGDYTGSEKEALHDSFLTELRSRGHIIRFKAGDMVILVPAPIHIPYYTKEGEKKRVRNLMSIFLRVHNDVERIIIDAGLGGCFLDRFWEGYRETKPVVSE